MKKHVTILTILIILLILIITAINKNYNKLFIITSCKDNICTTSLIKSNKETIFNKYDNVKIDEIINESYITSEDLTNLILYANKYEFNYGLNINNKVRLLSEEINTNGIIDYTKNKINLDKLNNYLKNKKINIKENDLSNIKTFNTNSYYKNKEVTKLKYVNGYNVKSYNNNEIDTIIKNSGNTLLNMMKSNGKFTYGYYANTGKIVDNYSIVRHIGTIYSLILYSNYINNDSIKDKIDLSINYLLNNNIKKKNNKYFVYDNITNEIKLGGNGLALLVLSEYQLVFNDNKYYDYAKKLANGILYLQNNDGSFNHVLNTNYKVKDKFLSSYYDGEATFGLLKLYQLTNNKKYYNASKKAIDYFIKKDYTKYHDQWITYSLNEFIKYNKNNKYMKFAINNYTNNIDLFDNKKDFSPTNFELLTTTYNINNNIDKLYNSIEYNKNLLLNYYIDNTYNFYFNNNKVLYGFMDLENNFRVRIDDIQHSLTGLINYKNIIDKR